MKTGKAAGFQPTKKHSRFSQNSATYFDNIFAQNVLTMGVQYGIIKT